MYDNVAEVQRATKTMKFSGDTPEDFLPRITNGIPAAKIR